ncbi:hypothetical protein DM860_004704 [Cuscuta australis]|uniref:Uncharacterized protein n=1 Tax=Cuscuta australis TaxID=267555 RepID=A0A328DL52_9ASTE|nr:hypothetical protein DM860_004704 [Cuscuta australis]
MRRLSKSARISSKNVRDFESNKGIGSFVRPCYKCSSNRDSDFMKKCWRCFRVRGHLSCLQIGDVGWGLFFVCDHCADEPAPTPRRSKRLKIPNKKNFNDEFILH